MFERIKKRMLNDKDVRLYDVTSEEIKNAEERMGFLFPESLKAFYCEVGYGFIKTSPNFINRIMSPSDIADFICESEEYEYVDKSIYNEDELVFMHIADEDFLTIEYKDNMEGAIKYFGEKIANSFIEFLEKMIEAPNYYI